MSNMCMCQVRDWRKNEWDYDVKNDNCRKFARNLDELIKNGTMIILNHWKEKINAA